MLLGRLPCVSGCLDAKRPPVVSDGLYFCYWFCWYDCFWLFLRFRRGFVGKDEVPSPSLPYPPLVLPSALLFVLQQPAYAVQDFAHFVFVVALANILYECFGVYPVFHVFPSGFKLAHHYQQTTGQSIDLIIQCGDMGAFQDKGRMDKADIAEVVHSVLRGNDAVPAVDQVFVQLVGVIAL